MALLATIKIDLSKIDKSKIFEGKNGAKYYDLQISVNDQDDNYGQNIQVTLPQTQEQRQAKEPRTFLGNGKVFWTDGKATKAGQGGQNNAMGNNNAPTSFSQPAQSDNDLPF